MRAKNLIEVTFKNGKKGKVYPGSIEILKSKKLLKEEKQEIYTKEEKQEVETKERKKPGRKPKKIE